MPDERFFEVRITADTATTVRVSAVDSDQACQRAMARVPALGQGWEVRRTRAEILNVSRTGRGEDHDQSDQQ